MKFTKKTITTLTLAVCMMASSGLAFANVSKDLRTGIVPIKAELPAKDMIENYIVARGNVSEINNEGTRLTVQGDKEQDKIIFNINPDTEIIGSKDGKKLTAKDIKQGVKVNVYYNGILTKSLPGIGNAKAIIVDQEEGKNDFGHYGVVLNVDPVKDKDYNRVLVNNDTILNINKDTKIVDAEGKDVKLDAIKSGTKVMAYYKIVTASIPGIATPEKVIVLSNTQEKPEIMKKFVIENGSVAEINNEGTRLKVQGDKEENKIIFNINSDTEIIGSKDGKKLTAKDIKQGVKVNVYYNGILTRSLPGMGNAEVIIIDQEEGKNEFGHYGVVLNVDPIRAEKYNYNRVLINNNQDTILNIYENTKIVDTEGNAVKMESIKPGTKVMAYYKIMTMSIPGITNPEKVIVLSNTQVKPEKKEVTYKGIVNEITVSKNKKEGSVLVQNILKTGLNPQIRFNVSTKTQIMDGKTGKKLAIKDIKKNSVITVYYNGILSRSMPPIGSADKVIVNNK